MLVGVAEEDFMDAGPGARTAFDKILTLEVFHQSVPYGSDTVLNTRVAY